MEMREDLRGSLPQILKSLGFTKYEALVYVALLGMEGATATEIHEFSRVPRASVYPVLDRLIGKNLVTISEATPKRFSAIPPAEGIANLLAGIERDALHAKEILSEIYSRRVTVERGNQELIWSFYGEEQVTARVKDLLARAERRVQVITSGSFMERVVLPELQRRGRPVEVEAILDRWEGTLPAEIQVHVRSRHIMGHGKTGLQPPQTAGIFIVDGEKALIVMGVAEETPTALFSESPGFLRFFSQIWSLNLAMVPRADQPSS
ncbi:MAG TPA: helix-turn-helix domain-containing protein [Methanomicrobiales archaeon]|nr:helix-turn-helix domain-containing protein [Methanomicrobiales archaeon]